MDSITMYSKDGDWNGIKAPAGGWSSLIGIVTAICGNVLISFALNTQRYAHMRLGRQREEEQEKKRRRKSRGYGTTAAQEAIAEQRERANLKGSEDVAGDSGAAGESSPLIPKINGKARDGGDDGHDYDEEGEEIEQTSYLKSPIWWLGISMMVVGEAGNFLAYGFAPASIVSPMGVVALVSNCLIAPLLLGERFRWRDGVGVIIAIAGCVTVVLSASDSNPKLTPEAIWKLITQWEFETYLGITVFLIVALMVASNKFGDRSILIDLGLVGLFGGYTALSTKGIASLLSNKVWRIITFPITYLLVAVLVFTAIMQIKYVNRALQRFNATMVIPTQFVLFTLSVIIGSAVLYRDFERESTEDAIKFVAGCALTFLGVWCITSGRNDDEEEDEEYGQENGDINLIDEEGVERDVERNLAARGRFLRAQSQMEHLPSKVGSLTPSVIVTPGLEGTDGDGSPTMDLDNPSLKAAVHSDAAELPPPQRPAIHATTSDPTIAISSPSGARPKTPLGRSTTHQPNSSTPQYPPQTPRNNSTPQLPDPSTTASSRLLPRATLFPGPLTSPLSSSLTAVVADSLRRGVDPASTSSLRRRASTINRRRQSRPQSTSVFPSLNNASSSRVDANAPPRKRHSIASGEMDVHDETIASLRARAAADSPRTRSLSTTLSDMFRPALKKKGTGSSNRNNHDED